MPRLFAARTFSKVLLHLNFMPSFWKYAPYPFPHIIQYKHFSSDRHLKIKVGNKGKEWHDISSGPLRCMDGLTRKFTLTPWTWRSGSVYVITVSVLRRPSSKQQFSSMPLQEAYNISSSSINTNQCNSPDIV